MSREGDRFKEVIEWLRANPAQELDWSLERLEYYKDQLFKQAKYKIGDLVQLKETPTINAKESWGWLGYKELLVVGRAGTVEAVDHFKGEFRYDVAIGGTQGLFTFYEKMLEKATKCSNTYACFCGKCGKKLEGNNGVGYCVCKECIHAS